jgi:hypothetical protein
MAVGNEEGGDPDGVVRGEEAARVAGAGPGRCTGATGGAGAAAGAATVGAATAGTATAGGGSDEDAGGALIWPEAAGAFELALVSAGSPANR